MPGSDDGVVSKLQDIGERLASTAGAVGLAAYLATPWGATYRAGVEAVLAEDQAWAKLEAAAGTVTDAMRAEVERRWQADVTAYRESARRSWPLRANAVDTVYREVIAGTWIER